MARTLVSNEELAAWLTAELQKLEDLEECRINAVQPLAKPDSEGCNWSDSIIVSCGGVELRQALPAVAKIVREARAKFNLA